MNRPCDNSVCVRCAAVVLSEETACLVTVPLKRWNKLAQATKAQLELQWDCTTTTNCFHYSCWTAALDPGAKRETRYEKIEFNLLNSVVETVERFDGVSTVRAQAKEFARLLEGSSHTVCFTGAGVSASAGIPTYRGADGIDTAAALGGALKLDTQEAALASSNKRKASPSSPEARKKSKVAPPDDEEGEFSYSALQPTLTHRALAKLFTLRKVHYCITQNCDDLHTKGGFPRGAMSELHGNVFCEYCESCHREYFRDYEVDAWSTSCYNEAWFEKCQSCGWGHYTGRLCSSKRCRGKLRDTIVNFGDDLHERVLGGLPRAEQECRKADLCVGLGSSLTVTPANSLLQLATRTVICNLQTTDFDDTATIRVWATCDMLFEALFYEMGMIISSH